MILIFTNLAIGNLIGNGTTFVTAFTLERILGYKNFSVEGLIGLLLIIIGLYFCVTSEGK